MKRFIKILKRIGGTVAALIVFCTAFAVCAHAKSIGLSAQADSARAGGEAAIILYIDDPLRSITLELTYDDTALRYIGASGADKGASVQGSGKEGSLRVIYVNSGSLSGKLFKLRFEALRACDTTVQILPCEAVSSDRVLMTPDDKLSVKVSISASSSKSSRSSVSGGTSRSASDSLSDTIGAEDTPSRSGYRSLLPDDTAAWLRALAFCGVVVVLAALLFGFGLVIGRRIRRRDLPTQPPLEDHLSESSDPTPTDTSCDDAASSDHESI